MKQEKTKSKVNIYAVVVGTVLVLYAISVIFPLLWGFMTSFKEAEDFASGNYLLLPDMYYWELNKEYNQLYPGSYDNYDNLFGNYLKLFSELYIDEGRDKIYFTGWNLDKEVSKPLRGDFIDFVLNTLLYAGGTAFAATFAPCIMGYLCAKFRYKFCDVIYGFVLFVMVMPIVGNTTAVVTLLRRFSMYNSIWGMWIKGFTFANTYFLIYYAFFSGTSDTYAEAAQLDGASYFRVMWTIYIPLAAKTVSTVFLLQFVALYNDYNTCLVYIPTHFTLAYAVWHFSNGSSGHNDQATFNLAASMFLALPMVVLFAVFKNRLMGNISVGGVKE